MMAWPNRARPYGLILPRQADVIAMLACPDFPISITPPIAFGVALPLTIRRRSNGMP